MRFRLGRAQVDGGWESLMGDLLTGVCRSVFPWTDNSGVLNIAMGTNSNLQLWQGGALFDITPFGPPTPLGTDPLGSTNGSARIDVTHVDHGLTTGDQVKLFGATTIATVDPNGTWTITVDTADTYHFTAGSNANSTTTGGGSSIVETPQVVLPAGAIDGTGGEGYGTGTYSTGAYSSPSTAEFFPRTWSHDAWGQQLVASPRGGGLYAWANNTASRAAGVDGAPTQITDMIVAPMQGGYMLFAIGTNEEASGVFNPRVIRHSAIRDYNSWSTLTSTSREYTLPGSGRLVAARMIGPYMLVWSEDELFLGTFTGALDLPWSFDRVGKTCGLIGPDAAIVVGQTAYWISPDRQFYTYALGGDPQTIPCPIRQAFADNLAASQGDKIVASSNAEFSEVRFDYPDARDGTENSRFVRLNIGTADAGAWSGGIQARSAFVDAGPSAYPLGVAPEGNVYYHEKGHSADGSAFGWYIETAAQLIDVDWRLMLKAIWPDFQNQQGPVTISVTARETPQDPVPVTVTADPVGPGTAKADILITGRLFTVRFEGESSPTDVRIGRPVFESTQAGRF